MERRPSERPSLLISTISSVPDRPVISEPTGYLGSEHGDRLIALPGEAFSNREIESAAPGSELGYSDRSLLQFRTDRVFRKRTGI